MKTVIEYLNDLKEISGSDYKSAKMLMIEKSSLSMIRSRGKMSDETAVKMADILGVEREEVVMAATIARSEGEVKKTWEKISRQIGIAASFLLAIQSVSPIFKGLTYGICILCKIVNKSGRKAGENLKNLKTWSLLNILNSMNCKNEQTASICLDTFRADTGGICIS